MNFGQTPAQLFRKPHPRRAPPPSPPPALRYAPGRIELVGVVEPRSSAEKGGEKTSPVAFVSADGAGAGAGAGGASVLGSMTSTAMNARHALEASCQYRIVAVRADGTVGAHRLAFDAAVRKNEYSLECDAFGGGSSRRSSAAAPFAADAAARASPRSFATLAGGRVLLSCGHWDHGVRAAATEDGRELQIATGHRDLVTCLAVAALVPGAARRPWAKKRVFSPEVDAATCASSDADAASALVVSGSRDTTLCVWEVSPPPGGWGAALSRSGTARAAQLSFARGGGWGRGPSARSSGTTTP